MQNDPDVRIIGTQLPRDCRSGDGYLSGADPPGYARVRGAYEDALLSDARVSGYAASLQPYTDLAAGASVPAAYMHGQARATPDHQELVAQLQMHHWQLQMEQEKRAASQSNGSCGVHPSDALSVSLDLGHALNSSAANGRVARGYCRGNMDGQVLDGYGYAAPAANGGAGNAHCYPYNGYAPVAAPTPACANNGNLHPERHAPPGWMHPPPHAQLLPHPSDPGAAAARTSSCAPARSAEASSTLDAIDECGPVAVGSHAAGNGHAQAVQLRGLASRCVAPNAGGVSGHASPLAFMPGQSMGLSALRSAASTQDRVRCDAAQHAAQLAMQHASQEAPQLAAQRMPQHAPQLVPQHAPQLVPQHAPQHVSQMAAQPVHPQLMSPPVAVRNGSRQGQTGNGCGALNAGTDGLQPAHSAGGPQVLQGAEQPARRRVAINELLKDSVQASLPDILKAVQEYDSHVAQVPPAGCKDDAIKLFVGNVPKHLKQDTIAGIFQSIGPVAHVSVAHYGYSKKSKGSAFVWFVHRQHAINAILSMHGVLRLPRKDCILGPPLIVRPAVPSEKSAQPPTTSTCPRAVAALPAAADAAVPLLPPAPPARTRPVQSGRSSGSSGGYPRDPRMAGRAMQEPLAPRTLPRPEGRTLASSQNGTGGGVGARGSDVDTQILQTLSAISRLLCVQNRPGGAADGSVPGTVSLQVVSENSTIGQGPSSGAMLDPEARSSINGALTATCGMQRRHPASDCWYSLPAGAAGQHEGGLDGRGPDGSALPWLGGPEVQDARASHFSPSESASERLDSLQMENVQSWVIGQSELTECGPQCQSPSDETPESVVVSVTSGPGQQHGGEDGVGQEFAAAVGAAKCLSDFQDVHGCCAGAGGTETGEEWILHEANQAVTSSYSTKYQVAAASARSIQQQQVGPGLTDTSSDDWVLQSASQAVIDRFKVDFQEASGNKLPEQAVGRGRVPYNYSQPMSNFMHAPIGGHASAGDERRVLYGAGYGPSSTSDWQE